MSWLDALLQGATGPAGPQGPVGPSGPATVKTSTIGSAAQTIVSAPLPTASIALVARNLTATDGIYVYAYVDVPPVGAATIGGSLAASAPNQPGVLSLFPIAPSVPPPTWGAGALAFTVQGPQATVTAAGASSGHVRLTCATVDGVGPFASAITGESVTISGLTTCTEANGTHVATYVDSTHIDLAAVASVHTGADSGTIVEASARTLNWSGTIVVSPIAP